MPSSSKLSGETWMSCSVGRKFGSRLEVAVAQLHHLVERLFADVIAERRVEDHAVAEQDLAAPAVCGDRELAALAAVKRICTTSGSAISVRSR